MKVNVIVQKKTDPPKLLDIPQPLIDVTSNPEMTLCLIQGNDRIEPTVLIASFNLSGSICMQTSLDQYLAGADKMLEIAEGSWGWNRSSNYRHLLPRNPDPKLARKILIQQLEKEIG